MENIRHFFTNTLTRLKKISQKEFQRLQKFIDGRPFLSFLGLLGILLVVIVVGNALRTPKATVAPAAPAPKQIQVYTVNLDPQVRLQAKIEKSGVIQIVAQTAGVIQKINVKEGDHVARGKSLFSFSTNYQGGNVADLSRQINQKNYQFLQDTYDTQKSIIDQNRQIANTSDAEASQLRSITGQSINDTNQLINVDSDIMNGLDSQIQQLEAIDVNGASDSAILQLKEAEAGTLTSLNAAKAAVRSNQYTSSDSSEPAQLADLAKNVTLQQLDIQEQTLDLAKNLSQLDLQISQVNEGLMFPAAPVVGTVERIYVNVGQSVTPGTPLASIRGDKDEATAVVLVSQDIAQQMSRFQPGQLTVGSVGGSTQTINLLPREISQEPTDGTLHSVIYPIPDQYASQFSEGSYVNINVPIGVNYAHATHPYIPLDAVYQTSEGASVFLAKQGSAQSPTLTPILIAQSQAVQLGTVYGQFVEVLGGLNAGDQVIINRNVLQNDRVQIEK